MSNLGTVVADGAQSAAHPRLRKARRMLDVGVDEDESQESAGPVA